MYPYIIYLPYLKISPNMAWLGQKWQCIHALQESELKFEDVHRDLISRIKFGQDHEAAIMYV